MAERHTILRNRFLTRENFATVINFKRKKRTTTTLFAFWNSGTPNSGTVEQWNSGTPKRGLIGLLKHFFAQKKSSIFDSSSVNELRHL